MKVFCMGFADDGNGEEEVIMFYLSIGTAIPTHEDYVQDTR